MRLVRSTSLFAAGLLLAAVMFEATMRLVEATPLWRVGPLVEVSLYGPDRLTGYTHRPGVSGYWRTENRAHIRVSAQGLREDDTSYAKAPSTFRVALFGDSVTEALQVELAQTYQAVAERRFASSGRSVQVVNFSLAGATPVVSLVRARTKATRFAPDLAVFVHSAGDFLSAAMTDDSRFPAYRRIDRGGYEISYGFRNTAGFRLRTSRLGDAIYWLTDRSRFVGAVNGRLNVGLLADLSRSAPIRDGGLQSARCGADRVARHLSLWRMNGPQSPERAVLASFLRDLGTYRAKSGHPVALALLSLAPGCSLADRSRIELVHTIRARLAAVGVEFHDVDAALRGQLRNDESLTSLRGFGARLGAGHFNLDGHEAMARMLEKVIAPHLPPRR